MELFWQSESLGTEPYKSLSTEDRHAEQIILGFLCKKERPSFPFNRPMAEVHLRHLKRPLEGDKDLHIKYRSVIDDNVAKGHACKLTREEAHQRSNKTWYLPHHLVINSSKPGKIHVVFDAAAKFFRHLPE